MSFRPLVAPGWGAGTRMFSKGDGGDLFYPGLKEKTMFFTTNNVFCRTPVDTLLDALYTAGRTEVVTLRKHPSAPGWPDAFTTHSCKIPSNAISALSGQSCDLCALPQSASVVNGKFPNSERPRVWAIDSIWP